MTNIPETRYVRSGDADLAYQVFGSGADLVAIHGLPGHLEVMWELPEFAAFLDRLGTFGRVIMFDKRGTGMSDRVPGVPAAEQHMEDIIAVMDAAGSSRASVAGWADGAFMAAMLAATYPDRVSARVLGGLCLKALTGGRQPGLALDPDAIKALSDRIEAGWRQGLVAPVLAPSYTDDEHFRSWWRRLERYSATPSGRDSLRDIGVPIRAGLHTGEVERRGTGTTGLAVHVGARVAALAQASEVLVTSTVKMLVLGSGIGFADRGRHRLKGVPDQWQLFAVEHT